MKRTLNLTFHSIPLTCRGEYYSGMPARGYNPPEPELFEIEEVVLTECPQIDVSELISHFDGWEDLERLCLDEISKERM